MHTPRTDATLPPARSQLASTTTYHVCKHSLALGIFKDKVKVPVRFNCEPCGKRKAPAGASLRKRARALEIDK